MIDSKFVSIMKVPWYESGIYLKTQDFVPIIRKNTYTTQDEELRANHSKLASHCFVRRLIIQHRQLHCAESLSSKILLNHNFMNFIYSTHKSSNQQNWISTDKQRDNKQVFIITVEMSLDASVKSEYQHIHIRLTTNLINLLIDIQTVLIVKTIWKH